MKYLSLNGKYLSKKKSLPNEEKASLSKDEDLIILIIESDTMISDFFMTFPVY